MLPKAAMPGVWPKRCICAPTIHSPRRRFGGIISAVPKMIFGTAEIVFACRTDIRSDAGVLHPRTADTFYADYAESPALRSISVTVLAICRPTDVSRCISRSKEVMPLMTVE